MKTGETMNEHGTPVSSHICPDCGDEFTVCPAVSDDREDWGGCLARECKSYDPKRDIDVLFASDAELAEMPIISMDMLRKRQQGTKLSDGTYAASLDVLKHD